MWRGSGWRRDGPGWERREQHEHRNRDCERRRFLARRRPALSGGLASIALNAAIQTLKDERATDFALLFCEPHNAAFYRHRGWKPFTGEIFAAQPDGRVAFDILTPLVFYLRRAPHEGMIDLCGLP